MTRNPESAAAKLAGLASKLSDIVLEDAEIIRKADRPTSVAEAERRSRACGVVGRTAVTLHTLQAIEDRPNRPQDEDDMNDKPDEPEELERKCAELRALLDRYGEKIERIRAARESGADRHRHGYGQLADEGQRYAA